MRKIIKSLSNRTVITVVIDNIIRLVVVSLIIIITAQMIHKTAIQITIASLCIILYTILDAVIFRRHFKQEAEQFLGWQLLWIYPSNQIKTIFAILTICIVVLLFIVRKIGHVQNDSIIIGVTTGIIASGIIVLFSELSNNHKNNLKRLAALNDYINVVHFYKDDIDLNKKRVETSLKEEKLHSFDMDDVLTTIKELGESAEIISEYSYFDLQAIAWEIIEYGDLLCNTVKNHSELLYLKEIKSLNNICYSISSIKSRFISSVKINGLKVALQEQSVNSTSAESYDNVKTNSTEESLISYLFDISREQEIAILSGLIIMLVYFDQNMKLLNQYVLYIDNKEQRHLKHLSKKVDRLITE